MVVKISRWDTADYLKTKEDIAAYLDVALEDGDPELVKLALSNIARAKGMTEVAKQAHLGRASLYKALSPEGNPEFATVTKVLKSLGLRLSVAAETMRQPASRGASAPASLKTQWSGKGRKTGGMRVTATASRKGGRKGLGGTR